VTSDEWVCEADRNISAEKVHPILGTDPSFPEELAMGDLMLWVSFIS
jgi:hypothetical protein